MKILKKTSNKIYYLVLLLSFIPLNIVNAQSPSKQETIDFIQSTLEEGIGVRCRGQLQDDISKVTFDGNSLRYHTESVTNGRLGLEFIYDSSNIRWDKYSSCEVSKLNEEFVYIQAYFDVNFKRVFTTKTHYKYAEDQISQGMQSNLTFCISTDKVESVKKAFNRLKEISLSEKKNPFE